MYEHSDLDSVCTLSLMRYKLKCIVKFEPCFQTHTHGTQFVVIFVIVAVVDIAAAFCGIDKLFVYSYPYRILFARIARQQENICSFKINL